MRPFSEIKDLLKQLDEVTLLEILDLRSADIVDAFEELIFQRQEQLREEMEQWFGE